MFLYLVFDSFLNNSRKSGLISTGNPLPIEISSRQINPGESSPLTITLNNSAREIETEKRKQDI